MYATFLGGASADEAGGIVVDRGGAAYVTGYTESSNFPTTAGAFQTTYGGGTCGTSPNTYPCPDAFVARLNATGSGLLYSSFLGGADADGGSAIAIDRRGAAYLTGYTRSVNFPTTPGAFQTACGDCSGYNAFTTKLVLAATSYGVH